MKYDNETIKQLQYSISEEERPLVMSDKYNVISVCFMNYDEVGIAAKLRCDSGDEQWTFPQMVSDVDKTGMAEAAHRVLQRAPQGLKYTTTWLGQDTLSTFIVQASSLVRTHDIG